MYHRHVPIAGVRGGHVRGGAAVFPLLPPSRLNADGSTEGNYCRAQGQVMAAVDVCVQGHWDAYRSQNLVMNKLTVSWSQDISTVGQDMW
jgi:hypothetical protein